MPDTQIDFDSGLSAWIEGKKNDLAINDADGHQLIVMPGHNAVQMCQWYLRMIGEPPA